MFIDCKPKKLFFFYGYNFENYELISSLGDEGKLPTWWIDEFKVNIDWFMPLLEIKLIRFDSSFDVEDEILLLLDAEQKLKSSYICSWIDGFFSILYLLLTIALKSFKTQVVFTLS